MTDHIMVQECVDHYEALESPDGSLEINIRVPARFRDLWLVRLSELRATDEQIDKFGPSTEQ